MRKIVFVGAGSIVFTRRLFIDIIAREELRDSSFVMVDVDEERLGAITGYAREVVKQHGLATRVESTTERKAALEGADVVVTSIAVAGENDVRSDIFIPQKYGIEQMVGDTLGPGGVFRALRTAPVMVKIALQECAVEAILERDLRKAFHAAALDPLTSAILTLPEIKSMFDEMVKAERESLEEYL